VPREGIEPSTDGFLKNSLKNLKQAAALSTELPQHSATLSHGSSEVKIPLN
jgi:hypothetical protein